MKRFAAAAVLLTMGLFLAGCENKPAAPKGGTAPAANPADMMKNMPKPAGTEGKKPEGDAATEETKPEGDAATEETKPEGDAPATEEKTDGEEKPKEE